MNDEERLTQTTGCDPVVTQGSVRVARLANGGLPATVASDSRAAEEQVAEAECWLARARKDLKRQKKAAKAERRRVKRIDARREHAEEALKRIADQGGLAGAKAAEILLDLY